MSANLASQSAPPVEPDVLAALEQVAAAQGRELAAVVDEALRDYLDRARTDRARKHVLEALAQSEAEFDPLYAALAK